MFQNITKKYQLFNPTQSLETHPGISNGLPKLTSLSPTDKKVATSISLRVEKNCLGNFDDDTRQYHEKENVIFYILE